jgi:RecB family exonuclease
VPLLLAQAGIISARLCRLLEREKDKFSDYTVSETEKYHQCVEGGKLLVGKIDRVSFSPGEEPGPVIIDYKTNMTPAKTANRLDAGEKNFQMAMYVRLYENLKETPVGGAYFYSIQKNTISSAFDRKTKDDPRTPREKFDASMDMFEKYLAEFAEAVQALDFRPKDVPFKTCTACDYKMVCRRTYSLNQEVSPAS